MLRGLVVIALACAVAAPARADDAGARALANSLVAKAAAAFDAKRFDEAGALYLEAFETAAEKGLGTKPALLYNAGLSFERGGQCDRAAELLERYASLEEDSAEPPDLGKRLEAARRCAPEVKLESTPPGAQVIIDGRLRGTTPVAVRVAKGNRAVRLMLPGYATFDDKVQVESPQTLSWTLKPDRPPEPPPGVVLVPPAPAAPASAASPWPWVTGGVGVAAAVAGGVFLGLSQDRIALYEERYTCNCSTRADVLDAHDQAVQFQVGWAAAFIGAGVAGAATLILILAGGDAPAAAPASGGGLSIAF